MASKLQKANKILILQTGGTIDKDYPKRSRGYAFEICDAPAIRILNRAQVVVLTGAFKPEAFKDSDADFNLGFALGALSCMSAGGVFVAINGLIKQPNQTEKDKTSGNFYPL